MESKIVVITGASDGIGAEAARQLHGAGATVVIVGRSPAKTKAIADALGAKHYIADYSRLSEVRALAADLRRDLPRIDVLANNAGGILGKREITVDGHEQTLQVNHLAPFLLSTLLLDVLIASKASVINTSSVANRMFSDLDINDLEVAHGYSARKAYGNAKLENILFTRELHKRYHKDGITTAAFHPGNVASNFASETNSLVRLVYRTPLRRVGLISPARGADTLVWLATSAPGSDWRSGEYYYKRRLCTTVDKAANDPEIAQQLWEQSARLVAVERDDQGASAIHVSQCPT
jgi:NAD(P)-dependent dehydrogenase (short-subunit alcohol dehydrogenase family)